MNNGEIYLYNIRTYTYFYETSSSWGEILFKIILYYRNKKENYYYYYFLITRISDLIYRKNFHDSSYFVNDLYENCIINCIINLKRFSRIMLYPVYISICAVSRSS